MCDPPAGLAEHAAQQFHIAKRCITRPTKGHTLSGSGDSNRPNVCAIEPTGSLHMLARQMAALAFSTLADTAEFVG